MSPSRKAPDEFSTATPEARVRTRFAGGLYMQPGLALAAVRPSLYKHFTHFQLPVPRKRARIESGFF